MKRWAVLDLTVDGAPVMYVSRSRLYARWVSAWNAHTVVVPWERTPRGTRNDA